MENVLTRVLEAENAANKLLITAREQARIILEQARQEAAATKELELKRHPGEIEQLLRRAREDAQSTKESALKEASRQAMAMQVEKSGVIGTVAGKYFRTILKGRL
ncbi:MAG: ATP synthase F0 subunit B [Candidatus Omnitrophica bacterium]|nr:ATP synthase F0 subunit B [Candidatus Omnitrophota bacterium]